MPRQLRIADLARLLMLCLTAWTGGYAFRYAEESGATAGQIVSVIFIAIVTAFFVFRLYRQLGQN